MIYCVEDDRAIRDLMIYTLRASGFEAMGFENDSHTCALGTRSMGQASLLF